MKDKLGEAGIVADIVVKSAEDEATFFFDTVANTSA
jgi:hypothetical protein